MIGVSLIFISLGLVAGDNCLDLVNTDFPSLSASFNTQAAACRGVYQPVSPAKAFNDKIFRQDGGQCWAYQVDASTNRYRFVMSAYTDAKAQLYADPSSGSWGMGNFYEVAALCGPSPTLSCSGDLLDNASCGAPSPPPVTGFTNAGQGWCEDAQGRGFRHYRIEQPGITLTECLTECKNMPECGSINYLTASSICIVDVDHAVSPATATAPLWTMVSGGQGMHPVTQVDASGSSVTVCYSKDTVQPAPAIPVPGFTSAGQGWCEDAQGRGFRHYRIEQPGITVTECLTECKNMPECGSVNYLPASSICIVDVDHAVSPFGATAPLWTMVSGGQGMHPVTQVDPSGSSVTVCYSKDNSLLDIRVSGFTNVGQGWCEDGNGRGFRHYRIEQPGITQTQCLNECKNMPECGSINYLPSSSICIVDVDHAVSPASATAPLWTMVSGGQGMHPVTQVDPSGSAVTVCYSKGAPTPTPRPVAPTPQPVATPTPAPACKVMLKSGTECLHTQGNNASSMWMTCPDPTTASAAALALFQFDMEVSPATPNMVKIKNSRGQFVSYQAPWVDSAVTRNWRSDYHQVWERRVTPFGVQFWNTGRNAFLASTSAVNAGFAGFTTDASQATFESSSAGITCSTPSAPPTIFGFDLKGEGICVDGSSRPYGTYWHNQDGVVDATKCMQVCKRNDGCVGVMYWPPSVAVHQQGCTLNFEPNRGFNPTNADRRIGTTGWTRMDENWAEWVGGFGSQHLGQGAVSGVVAAPFLQAYCYSKQDQTDACGAPGSARFGCCPQMPYGRLDAGRSGRLTGSIVAELAICTTTGEPHIMDFTQKITGAGQSTHVEGDFVLYEGKLLEVSVRTTANVYHDNTGARTIGGTGNNAWTMTGALIGYNTIEYFAAAELGSGTITDRAQSEVYWNGVPTTTQELCQTHLKDYTCSCRFDSDVYVLPPGGLRAGNVFPDNTDRHIEIVFNKEYMFRANTWYLSQGWIDIVLTVDPLNVGKPGLQLSPTGQQVTTTLAATIATGRVPRGGLCNKGGIVSSTTILDYKIDCSSNNAFLINRLGGSMLTHDPLATSFCYRRRQEVEVPFDASLSEDQHVAQVINQCDSQLKDEAMDYCKICDTVFLHDRCVFDACAVGEIAGALGSRNFCKDKLLIFVEPGQEATVCDATEVWDDKRQICLDASWTGKIVPAPTEPPTTCECRQTKASYEDGARCLDTHDNLIGYRKTENWCCSDYGCKSGYKWVVPEPECEEPSFIKTCITAVMKIDGCSILENAQRSDEDGESIEEKLAGVPKTCFMCENIGTHVQEMCKNRTRSPLEIVTEILEDAEELEGADLPDAEVYGYKDTMSRLNVLKKKILQASRSLGKSKKKVVLKRNKTKADRTK